MLFSTFYHNNHYLKNKNLVYEGRLPPPKGQLPDDWEDREQTLFRSTLFGDDVDNIILTQLLNLTV